MIVKATLLALALLVTHAAPLKANPVGNFEVEGRNPGSDARYIGNVSVRRTGDTYAVRWRVGRQTFVGTGLGAVLKDGKFTIGPANAQDGLIAVSYVSGRSFGLAFFIRQADGTWNGIWTYGGSRRIGREAWVPR